MDRKESIEPDKGLGNKKRSKLLWQIPLLLALVVGLVPLVSKAITGNYNPLGEVWSNREPQEVERPWERTMEADGTEFVIPLKGGDRVEIEVSNTSSVVSTIKDPFGNPVGQSATKTGYYNEYVPFTGRIDEGKWETRNYLVSTQQYPWRFAFIAATTGNYSVEVVSYIDYPHKAQYKEAHLKVTSNSVETRIESIVHKPPPETTAAEIPIVSLPFVYTGKGNGRTPAFRLQESGAYLERFKLTYKTSWDGDITIRFHLPDNPNILNVIDTRSPWRSTKTWSDFPDAVRSGATYEWIFLSDCITINEYYLSVEDTPPDGQWTVTISSMGFVTSSTKVDVEVAVEYAGKWEGREREGTVTITSGNQIERWSGPLEVPIEYTVRKLDGGTGPMTVKIIYFTQVVTQKTVHDEDEVYAYWPGP